MMGYEEKDTRDPTCGCVGSFPLLFNIEKVVKVQMKCFSLLLNLKEQQKSGRSPFTVS